MALVLAFLSAENENRQLEDLLQAHFGRLPERLFLSVRTKSIIENFVNWKLDQCWFCDHDSTHFSILRVGTKRTLRLLFGDCRFIYFHSLMKSAFLLSKGLLCLYNKQNNTWLLVDMEFLFSRSTRYLSRSLHSLVSYRFKHSKRNSLSTRAHVLFAIYTIIII